MLVQRVDSTADDRGGRRLLKGVRYTTAQRVQPGGTVQLVSSTGAADPAEIALALALDSIAAIVFFTDEDGQTGIVSAAARVPELPDRGSLASLEIRQFTVSRRQNQGRFVYAPQLTLAETSGRSRASIRKIVFELLDVGAASQAPPLWNCTARGRRRRYQPRQRQERSGALVRNRQHRGCLAGVRGDLVRGRCRPRRTGQCHRAGSTVGVAAHFTIGGRQRHRDRHYRDMCMRIQAGVVLFATVLGDLERRACGGAGGGCRCREPCEFRCAGRAAGLSQRPRAAAQLRICGGSRILPQGAGYGSGLRDGVLGRDKLTTTRCG